MTTSTSATVLPFIPVFSTKEKKRAMPKWSEARRAKFMRTVNRRTKKRLREEREQARAERATSRVRLDGRGREKGQEISSRRPSRAAVRAPRGSAETSIGPHAETAAPRSGRDATEERFDAIAYLRAATAGYEHVPTSVCLSLLALRRLLGQIK